MLWKIKKNFQTYKHVKKLKIYSVTSNKTSFVDILSLKQNCELQIIPFLSLNFCNTNLIHFIRNSTKIFTILLLTSCTLFERFFK